MAQFFAKAEKSELYIYDAIGQDYFGDGITAKSISDALKEFKPNSALDIYLNSPGGSVFEGIAIYNQLMRWGGKKTVHIDGLAASIASIIALCGNERRMASNALYMCHSAWSITVGNAKDMRKMADSLDKIDETLISTYVDRAGCKESDIRAWCDAETWMNADEAVSRGFATMKTGEKAVKAEFPLLAKFNKVPDQLRRQALSSNVLLAKVNARVSKLNRRPAGVLA